jgi:uncharacterized OB-fold protein
VAAKKPETDKRFAKFGVVSFTATTKVNDFVDYLEKGKVAGTKCKTCGSTFFPPRADCHRCFEKGEMEWFEVQGTGRLMTYSVLQYAPVGFQDQVPYAIAVADYGDFKVFGRIKDIPEDGIPLGAEVRAEVRKLPDDRYIYEFVQP